MEEISIINCNKEKILQVSIYGGNRDEDIKANQERVFDYFGYKMNYVRGNFPAVSHGCVINQIINQCIRNVDYIMIWDIDSIPLRKDFLQVAYDKIKDKQTLMGGVAQSNHKKGIDGTFNHPYCGIPFFTSSQLLLDLGLPDCDHHHNRSDTLEEVSWACEEKGFNICLVWPSNVIGLNEAEMKSIPCPTSKSSVGNGHFFGFGTTYGQNLFYHQMCAPAERHKEMFLNKCAEVINGK